eukprot:TRINITY_DN6173_c0_g1_i3.p1 TRINITY_DN6173_c0_g1~~TRINITY_DN6173_c0_g1_i3.p1  ORF type:complete len:387 (-),score=63.33 TRINITY_DN6173_c0_g1_i3:110-1270(-)
MLFDRRVDALLWHPSLHDTVVAGSHGGDVSFWKFSETLQRPLEVVSGLGKGGAILQICFKETDSNTFITTSHDSTLKCHNSEFQQHTIWDDTHDYDHWFCSVSISTHNRLAVAVDNRGLVHGYHSESGKKMFAGKIHKTKISHVEWSPKDQYLFVTASNDKTMKLYDVRMITKSIDDKDWSQSYLYCLKQDGCTNSARFSPSGDHKLLVTSQNSELRIYDLTRLTEKETTQAHLTIPHPHRFYQHMTPIKAAWHPLLPDIAIVGRYDDIRGVDVIDTSTGDWLHNLQDPQIKTISNLSVLSDQAHLMATCSGNNVFVWRRRDDADLGKRLSSSEKAKSRSVDQLDAFKHRRSVREIPGKVTDEERQAQSSSRKRSRSTYDHPEKKK